jgi:hypothetical protein
METNLKFRMKIFCTRNIPRFQKYLPVQNILDPEPSTEGKIIWVDVKTTSFTQTLEELKTCVKGVYVKNNVEEGWFSKVEFY